MAANPPRRQHLPRRARGPVYARPRLVRDPGECWFYHTMDLPGIGTVNGDWDLRSRFDEYIGHVALAGKTMLDVGTASGFLTFAAEKRGADVVSFDAASAEQINCLPGSDQRDGLAKELEAIKNSYRLAHRLLGSRARVIYGELARLAGQAPICDVVLVAQILVHLRDPLEALRQASLLARETLIVVECAIAAEFPSATFLGQERTRGWWVLTDSLYKTWLDMCGFDLVSAAPAVYVGAGSEHTVWTFVARRRMAAR
jgi:hypothetical protein